MKGPPGPVGLTGRPGPQVQHACSLLQTFILIICWLIWSICVKFEWILIEFKYSNMPCLLNSFNNAGWSRPHRSQRKQRRERPFCKNTHFSLLTSSIKTLHALSQSFSHPSHARVLVPLNRDYVGCQVLQDLKERWEKQWVCFEYCRVFHTDNIRLTSVLCRVTQGRTGMNGGRGIPGEPGSKVNLHQCWVAELQRKKFSIYCIW